MSSIKYTMIIFATNVVGFVFAFCLVGILVLKVS